MIYINKIYNLYQENYISKETDGQVATFKLIKQNAQMIAFIPIQVIVIPKEIIVKLLSF